jgi:hypothetical protein
MAWWCGTAGSAFADEEARQPKKPKVVKAKGPAADHATEKEPRIRQRNAASEPKLSDAQTAKSAAARGSLSDRESPADVPAGTIEPAEPKDIADVPAETGVTYPYLVEPVDEAIATDNQMLATPVHFQAQPPIAPGQQLQPTTPLPQSASDLSGDLFGGGVNQSLLGQRNLRVPTGVPSETVGNAEVNSRVTTDTGSLIGQSPRMLGIGLQRRTPIVNDPRIRGSRVGQLAATGSHWVPARIDLNTAVSQVDSHLIGDVSVIKGPYSVLFGPGLQFVNMDLIATPRFEGGRQWDGSSNVVYKTNGQQIYGRQDLWGGDDNSGWRAGYGYANGNNYVSGNGTVMPSGYTSQDVFAAYGYNPDDESSIEVNYLGLIQNAVQYPGQAFDITKLNTNGVDFRYKIVDQANFDQLTVDAWYNATAFNGNAQNPLKRQMFPYLSLIDYVGFTFVNSVSSGYTATVSWGDEDQSQLTLGTDFRAVNQQLNEFGSGVIGFNIFTDANSPIPASRTIDPAVFAQQVVPFGERLIVTTGVRADVVNADVTANLATMSHLGNLPVNQQSSLAAILGSSEFNRTYGLFGGYISGDLEINEDLHLVGSGGSTQRPPSLTELYAAQPFMFLIQNGLNTVTGDPQLLAERIAQFDLSLQFNYDRWQGSLNGFHAWGFNYITFENIGVVRVPPDGTIAQTNLKYVNTDLATFAGADAYVQYLWNDYITPYFSCTYVDARDRTRNGDFATRPVEPGLPSIRVYGLPRGFFSGIPGTAQENLPGIYPFQARFGVRLHPNFDQASGKSKPPWEIEVACRLVSPQYRVATSLDEVTSAGFAVWELRGIWQPSDRMQFVGGIENFTDRNYREHLDFHSPDGLSMLQPGINGYVGGELWF